MSKVAWPPQPSNSITSSTWHYRGAFSTTRAYVTGELVTVGSIMYLATVTIPAGSTPVSDSRWAKITVGAAGARGQQGLPGVDGVDGAPGARGEKGPVGPMGTAGGLGVFTWTDLVLEDGWAAVNNNPPQWAIDASDTVWLRGEADNDGAQGETITHLPEVILPGYKHEFNDFYQSVEIFGAAFAANQRGRVAAADTDHAVHLATSYRVTSSDPRVVGAKGILNENPWGGDLHWERTAPNTMRVAGTGAKDDGFAALLRSWRYDEAVGPGPGIGADRLQPLIVNTPIPYRYGADILTLNSILEPDVPNEKQEVDGTWGAGTAHVDIGGLGGFDMQVRAYVEPFWAFDQQPPDADERQVINVGIIWNDCPYSMSDVDPTFGNPDLLYGATSIELDVTFNLPFMDF